MYEARPIWVEWEVKLQSEHEKLRNQERVIARHLDDLAVVLLLMTQISRLYKKFDDKVRHNLL